MCAQSFSNIEHLTQRDEVKFVIGSREDYDWSCDKVRLFNLSKRCHAVLFSPIFGRIDPREIVEWILATDSMSTFNCKCTSSSGRRRSAGCDPCARA